jgi:MFS family permease
MHDQPTAQRAIIISGCFGMIYTQLTMSPATIEFARSFGADGLHIGILGALPSATLFMQFGAAVLVNHLQYRRRTWFAVSIAQRLVFLPLALGPFVFREVAGATWVWVLIVATTFNHAMLHFSSPLWMSWMGDYLPREGLNRFWGKRHLWMQWTAALSLLVPAIFLLDSRWSIQPVFAILIVVGAIFGVADILMSTKIIEPAVQRVPQPKIWQISSAPFRDRSFRSFISYTCFWHFAAMVGAPFISLYLLDKVGMPLSSILIMWAGSWCGGAALSRSIGSLTEQFGHRPMLILCTTFKAINMAALLVIPPNPTWALMVFTPVFMIDALLNAGIAIASNGFMLKNSPRQNRTMFIAASTACAGMIGGVTAITAGAILRSLSSWSMTVGGWTFVGFHILFAASLVLRLACILLAVRLHEPESAGARYVASQLIGTTPLRFLRFPVGLYRNADIDSPSEDSPSEDSPSEDSPSEDSDGESNDGER